MGCDFCGKSIEDVNSHLMETIYKHSYAVLAISGDEANNIPWFTYTVGLMQTIKHPDFIIAGLPPDITKKIIKNIYNYIVNKNEIIEPDTEYTGFLPNNLPVIFKTCKKIAFDEYMYKTNWFNNEATCENAAYQIVWPDHNNLFPWDEGFNERIIPLTVNLYD